MPASLRSCFQWLESVRGLIGAPVSVVKTQPPLGPGVTRMLTLAVLDRLVLREEVRKLGWEADLAPAGTGPGRAGVRIGANSLRAVAGLGLAARSITSVGVLGSQPIAAHREQLDLEVYVGAECAPAARARTRPAR
jgi:hypothetical protein